MRRPFVLILTAFLAAPAFGQDLAALPDAVALLKGKTLESRLDGAIVACLTGVSDPVRAEEAYELASWLRNDEFDGTIAYQAPGVSTMFWDAADPGFCMIETDRMGTQALLARLTGLLDGAGWVIPRLVTVEGCPALDLGTGVTVAPTSAGQDPLCSAQENAALRFQAKN